MSINNNECICISILQISYCAKTLALQQTICVYKMKNQKPHFHVALLKSCTTFLRPTFSKQLPLNPDLDHLHLPYSGLTN